MNLLIWLISESWQYILGGLLLVAAYFGAKGQGRAEAETTHLKADAAAANKAAVVRRDVSALSDDGVADQLRKRPWRKQ
jgi:hypothetical protein